MQITGQTTPAAFRLNRSTGELLLAAVILARSTSFLFNKITLQTMTPLNLIAVRFLLAFLCLALLFHKKFRSLQKGAFLRGMVLGAFYFAIMAAELFALKSTPSATVSLLENTAIVLVPLLECALSRKLPRPAVLFSVSVTFLGVVLLSLGGSGASPLSGKLLSITAAMLYSAAIILTDRFSRQADALTIGIFQVGFIGVFALCAAALLETPALPATHAEWGMVLVLALVCTCFGYTLQPVAQSHTTAARTGMLCALNPIGAAVLGHIFLNEKLGLWGLAGAVFVLFGILLTVLRKE